MKTKLWLIDFKLWQVGSKVWKYWQDWHPHCTLILNNLTRYVREQLFHELLLNTDLWIIFANMIHKLVLYGIIAHGISWSVINGPYRIRVMAQKCSKFIYTPRFFDERLTRNPFSLHLWRLFLPFHHTNSLKRVQHF